MTYRRAAYIMQNGTRSREAAELATQLAAKALRKEARKAEILQAACFIFLKLLYYGGALAAMLGVIILGGELPPDYTGNIFKPYAIAAGILAAGVLVAYIGNLLLERSGHYEKRD